MNKDINGYSLSRSWFNFCFENPEKIRPNHTALYFFIIEHCNRLGWKAKFGLPTTMTMEAIGIRSYNTYKNTLEDLISFGFIVMVEKSKNQYSSNIVALSNFDKALDGALDKAIAKKEFCSIKKSESTIQSTSQSTIQSIDSIYKHINQEPLTGENPIHKRESEFKKTIEPYVEEYGKDICNNFFLYWTEPNRSRSKLKFEMQKTWDVSRRLRSWADKEKSFKPKSNVEEPNYQKLN